MRFATEYKRVGHWVLLAAVMIGLVWIIPAKVAYTVIGLAALAYSAYCIGYATSESDHSFEYGIPVHQPPAPIPSRHTDPEHLATELATLARQRAELIDVIEQLIEWLDEQAVQHAMHGQQGQHGATLKRVEILKHYLRAVGHKFRPRQDLPELSA